MEEFGVVFLHCRIDIACGPDTILDKPEPSDCGPTAQRDLETIK